MKGFLWKAFFYEIYFNETAISFMHLIHSTSLNPQFTNSKYHSTNLNCKKAFSLFLFASKNILSPKYFNPINNMKKVLLVAAVACFTLVSCKKDYTCTCTVTSNGTTQTYTYPLKDVKKKDAKSACNNAGAAWITIGGTCDFK